MPTRASRADSSGRPTPASRLVQMATTFSTVTGRPSTASQERIRVTSSGVSEVWNRTRTGPSAWTWVRAATATRMWDQEVSTSSQSTPPSLQPTSTAERWRLARRRSSTTLVLATCPSSRERTSRRPDQFSGVMTCSMAAM